MHDFAGQQLHSLPGRGPLGRQIEQHVHQPFDLAPVRPRLHQAQRVEALHDAGGLVLHGGEYGVDQHFSSFPRDLDHHAEIQQHDPALIIHQDVPGVRVGVEQSIHQHHLDVELLEPLHDGGGPKPAVGLARVEDVDPNPFDELHRQHVPCRKRGDRFRNPDPGIPGEVGPHQPEVLGLDRKIHFVADPPAEFLDDGRDRPGVNIGIPAGHPVGDLPRGLDVRGNQFSYPGAEDLHRDLAPPIARPMNLTQRSGGEG